MLIAERNRDVANAWQPKSLFGNFSWTLGGNILSAGGKAVQLMIIAKLGSPRLVGQYSLGLAIGAPIVLFLGMQLNAIQGTDTRRAFQMQDYMGFRVVGMSIALGAIAAIALLGVDGGETRLIVLLVGVSKAVEAMSDVLYGLFQHHERMEHVAKSQMLKAILQPVGLALPLALGASLSWSVIGIIVASVICAITYDFPIARKVLSGIAVAKAGYAHSPDLLVPRFDWTHIKALLVLAFPLGIVALVDSLNANIPRYFLQSSGGEVAVGYYSALAFLMVTGGTVMTSMSYAFRPRLARYYISDHLAFRELHWKLIAAGAAAGAVGVICSITAGGSVLAVLYTSDYSKYADVLVWMMIAAMGWYIATCAAIGITAARMFAVQAPILLATAGTTAVACAILIPSYGMIGAVWAVCAGLWIRLALVLSVCVRANIWSRS